MRVRVRPALVTMTAAATVVVGLTAPTATATPTPAPAAKTGHESVIVVLRNQLTGTPAAAATLGARRSAAHSDQHAVLARLSGPAPTHLINYTVGNAFSATVTSAQAAVLAADPAVASVVPNRKMKLAPTSPATPKATKATRAATGAAPATVDPAACSTNPNKPLLEPEALQTIDARSTDPSAKTAASLGITGAGVKVAFIADGINPQNKGFLRRNGKSSIVDYKDFYGDGPNAVTSGAEAFGDASAISAQGNAVYDVADYANPANVKYPGGHCYIKIVGVAPGADVVALKAGSELLPNSAILQSIDYAVSVAHVNVINESFGQNTYPDGGSRNTIALFNDQAVAAGVTITQSTGDAGISSTIGSSSDPKVINTGASTDSRLYEQTNYALAAKFGNGKWLDNNTSALSSAGITQGGRTIDVDAPGEADWATCDSGGNFVGCTSFGNPSHPYADIQAFGGTSQSAPITAGVAALVIQAYRKTHDGTSPSPAVVKKIITSTARDLGLPGDEQGSGVIDARAAVEAALTWPGATTAAPAGTGSNIALSSSQLTLKGAPGSTQTGKVTVTNVGTKSQTIVASARRYASLGTDEQSVFVNPRATRTTPYPTTGAPWVYKRVSFDVPSGADELASTIRWNSGAPYGGAGPVVRLSIFTPDGTYAGNTRPQGGAVPANYGLITIKHPQAGTWTGVLYTPVTGGFRGNVAFDSQSLRAIPVGSISPANATLAPGASTTVTANLTVPSVGGDTVNTISIGSSGGHQVAVPVILRAQIPTSGSSPGTFAGEISGGNARAYSPAQTFSYDFTVPKGRHDVEVTTTLADDPKMLLEGVLIDPNGEVQSVNTNQITSQGLSMVNTVADPEPGDWRFVIVVNGPVSGDELREDFSGTVAFNQVFARIGALPTSIKAGNSVTRTISVTNRGKSPMLVQVDARRNYTQQLQLAPQFAGSTLQLPQDVDDLSQLPAYLVPPDTTSMSVSSSATVPAQIELSAPLNGIDAFGDLDSAKNGDTVSTAKVSEAAGQVGLGYWFPYVQEIGPYPDGGAPSATAVLSGSLITRAFDSGVTSSTGDPFLSSVDPTADPGSPLVIEPGHTGKIAVTIAPTAKAGATIKGVLHLVTTPIGVANLFNTTGEVLANVPYTYKVS